MGRWWDFRLNGYIPFSTTKNTCTCIFDDYIGDFFAIKTNIESVSYSLNAELGWLMFDFDNSFSLYGAAGPYFLARENCSGIVGGEIRLRPQYRDYIAVDLSWRHDSFYGTIWQAELILTIPFYQIFSGRNKRPCGITDRQIYQSVERMEIMPVTKRTCWFTNF